VETPYEQADQKRAGALAGGPFRPGDAVVLYDRKRRRYRLRLLAGAVYHTHLGAIAHDSLIGQEDGTYVTSATGHRLLALRPTLAESVLEMQRYSQVIYPKDLGALLLRGDIFPGATVLEIGLGSGAATATLLRAVGPSGRVVSYEVRSEIVEGAKKNIAQLVPNAGLLTVRLRDACAEGIEERNLDRIVADVPEPWLLVDSAAQALRPGGVFLCFLPTALQVHQAGMALARDPRWALVETVELLERPWHVAEQSVRPVHRMVAHTGFITTARRVVPPSPGEAPTLREPPPLSS